jgi:hypothetical protein
MSVTAPIFTKLTRVRQLYVRTSYTEFQKKKPINGLVADTGPQMDSRRTYGVYTQDVLVLLRKERLIKTTSVDEINTSGLCRSPSQ